MHMHAHYIVSFHLSLHIVNAACLSFVHITKYFYYFLYFLSEGNKGEMDILYKETVDEKVKRLSDVFPDHDMKDLTQFINTSNNLEDAADSVLETMDNKSEKKQLTSSTSILSDVFDNLVDLLCHFQSTVIGNTLSMEVTRSEIWRVALAFYKKCVNKPEQLKKAFEVGI